MTQNDKERVIGMTNAGMSPSDIADELNISRNTIKSFLRRNKPVDIYAVCRNCGKQLEFTPHKKKKHFCSDKCRMHYWNMHPEKMKLTNAITIKCEVCGKPVLSYRKKTRRYCSRTCAAIGRMHHE